MPPVPPDPYASITSFLVRWREGDEDALSHLSSQVYSELHRMAAGFLHRERDNHTLQPTALVHELYLKLPGIRTVDWKSRAQFFSLAARIMRNILVDYARQRGADRRDASLTVHLGDLAEEPVQPFDIVQIDRALAKFAE